MRFVIFAIANNVTDRAPCVTFQIFIVNSRGNVNNAVDEFHSRLPSILVSKHMCIVKQQEQDFELIELDFHRSLLLFSKCWKNTVN